MLTFSAAISLVTIGSIADRCRAIETGVLIGIRTARPPTGPRPPIVCLRSQIPLLLLRRPLSCSHTSHHASHASMPPICVCQTHRCHTHLARRSRRPLGGPACPTFLPASPAKQEPVRQVRPQQPGARLSVGGRSDAYSSQFFSRRDTYSGVYSPW